MLIKEMVVIFNFWGVWNGWPMGKDGTAIFGELVAPHAGSLSAGC